MENTFVRPTLVGRLAFTSVMSPVRGGAHVNSGEKIPSLGRARAGVRGRVVPRGCQKVDYLGTDFLTGADPLQVNGLLITGLRVCMC